jgi:hypothetical protein
MEKMKGAVTIAEWIDRFRAVGLDEQAMRKWHRLFEEENPDGHQGFLEWLGASPEQIADIRNM